MSYTTKEVSYLQSLAPITKDVAIAASGEMGKTYRSIISKAVMLKIYEKAAPRAAAISKPTKADIIQEVEERLRLPHGDLGRLDTLASLRSLLSSILALEEIS